MNVFTVWDELNGEEKGGRRVTARTSLHAAEIYARNDFDGHTEGLYDQLHPILVRSPDGTLRRHEVVAEATVTYRATSDHVVHPGWTTPQSAEKETKTR